MTRLQMAGRWAQVVGAVLAWMLLVPLRELVRAAAERLGLEGRATIENRSVASRPQVATEHRRRAA